MAKDSGHKNVGASIIGSLEISLSASPLCASTIVKKSRNAGKIEFRVSYVSAMIGNDLILSYRASLGEEEFLLLLSCKAFQLTRRGNIIIVG